MTLSALIKKGGLCKSVTATPATLATQEADQPVTVAPVATVAVAQNPGTLAPLSPDEKSGIRVWLAHIEETDTAIIEEVLDQCRNGLEARRYFHKRSEEVPEPTICDRPVRCGDCIHFNRIDHPHLGHCAKGEPEAVAGLWDTDRRYCDCFLPAPKTSGNSDQRST
ncbi:MAG: hypothetical protein ACE5FQ_09835 [Thiogranum sp.]